MTERTHVSTTYVDVYQVDVPLHAVVDHPPMRATKVVIELEDVHDIKGTGPAKVHVTVQGERIVATEGGGFSLQGSGRRQVLGLLEEPERFELCRGALIGSLERHGLTTGDVTPVPFLDPGERHRESIAVGAVNLSGAVSRYLVSDSDEEDVEDDRF